MQIFELHFNPHPKKDFEKIKTEVDLIFDSFCYEPENIYEKRLGSLYIVGELKNVLPQNFRFLDNFAIFLKKQYYSTPIKFTPEASFKDGLKKSNEFLEKIVKGGDVSWLGNLNLAVLNFISRQKNFWEINLTKVGSVKILLLRGGQVIDIGKSLEFSEIEPYPLKIFGNIVSGKLFEGDIVMVLTEGAFSVFTEGKNFLKNRQKETKTGDFFQPGSLLEKIARINLFFPENKNSKKLILEKKLIEKQLKEILINRERDFLKISGICLLCVLTKPAWPKIEKPKTLTYQKGIERLSIRQVFLPFINGVKKIKTFFARKLEKINNLFLNLKRGFPKFKKPKIKAKKIKVQIKKPRLKFSKKLKRSLILVLILIIILILGFLIAKREKEQKLKEYQNIFRNIQEKTFQAEAFLVLNKTESANSLFKEAWQEILPLTKISASFYSSLKKEVFSLRDSVEEKLYQLNKLEAVETPELLFEFKTEEFIPQKMIAFGENLYFFSPYSQNIFKLTGEGKGNLIEYNLKFSLAAPLNNSILFFSKPDKLISFKDENFGESILLKEPYPDFSFDAFSSYKSGLYFLDKKAGEIIRYPSLGYLNWGSPQFWLIKKATDAKSMAVDGSVWILDKNNAVSRYYAGQVQESLKLDFFPSPKDLSKIFTAPALPYLYLLEPGQNRIIVLTKTGKIFQQFQSKKFDNLLDFAVSTDGKIIWLLNGLKLYQIKF